MLKIGIAGYGNLGRGVEAAALKNPDISLCAVFSRRNPAEIKTLTGSPVHSFDDILKFKDKIDVLILCGGSATDLPLQSPQLLKDFNIVDSFDTHAKIPEHFEKLDKVAKESGKCAVFSAGWDPGLFSLMRALFGAVLPDGRDYTFWGRGVSQGHSDAVRRIDGVLDARQYTIPKKEALDAVKSGLNPGLTARDKHLRECYVVLKEGADKALIEQKIKTMPNYFSEYDTIVHFISKEELDADHGGLPHGGLVFRSGQSSENTSHLLELSIKLDSNPEFTSSVLVACARAASRLYNEQKYGAFSILDFPIAYLSPKTQTELYKELL